MPHTPAPAPWLSGPDGSGRGIGRLDGDLLVSGLARYTADGATPYQAALHFVRSPHAHARILGIDVAAAAASPGVLGVWTGEDLVRAGVRPMPMVSGLQRPDGAPAASAPRHVLAVERVRHVGEAVVAIVAGTAREAQAAADALVIDYASLPAVVDPVGAMAPGAPTVCEAAPDNVSAGLRHGDAAATAEAFARAAHRVELDLVNQRVAACAMEPRSLRVEIDPHGDHVVFHASTQMPTGLRDALVELLPGLSADRLQVKVGQVGGGFGMKTVAYPEDVVACFAAVALRRSLGWQAERSEEFLAGLHARDLQCHAELALDAQGRVLALRVRGIANVGAYATTMGVVMPLVVAPMVATSVYDIPAVDLDCLAVMTHTAPVGAYRGAGQPEAIYTLERLMDAAARALALDPAELRRRNLVRPQQLPYRSVLGQVYDSGDFPALLAQALQLADWAGFETRRQAAQARGRLRGRGLASFLKWTGAFALEETARLCVTGHGWIDILCGSQEMGQGIATSQAQLALDVLGLPIACLRVVQGDTDRVPGFGSGGSRSLFTGGAAVRAAAEAVVQRACELAAEALEAAPADIVYRGGRLEIAGTDRGIGLFELAAQQTGGAFEVAATATATGPSWPNASHVCEVEVDPQTGRVEVVAYVSVNDVGTVVNPAFVRGQIDGAIVQGIGQALCEAVVYDAQGQLITGSLLDHALPRADVAGAFVTVLDGAHPCTTNRLGAKGAGELGVFGAPPAVVNAVVDALAAAGVGPGALQLQMPLTPERVWRVLATGPASGA